MLMCANRFEIVLVLARIVVSGLHPSDGIPLTRPVPVNNCTQSKQGPTCVPQNFLTYNYLL